MPSNLAAAAIRYGFSGYVRGLGFTFSPGDHSSDKVFAMAKACQRNAAAAGSERRSCDHAGESGENECAIHDGSIREVGRECRACGWDFAPVGGISIRSGQTAVTVVGAT
jgi:hypothetical protein